MVTFTNINITQEVQSTRYSKTNNPVATQFFTSKSNDCQIDTNFQVFQSVYIRFSDIYDKTFYRYFTYIYHEHCLLNYLRRSPF